MKTIPVPFAEVICAAKFRDRSDFLLSIGASPQNDIQMTKLSAHEPYFEIHRFRGMGNRVSITAGCHRAWLKMPSDISVKVPSSIDFQSYAKEPILSIFPVVTAALMLWQRANAKTDLKGNDVFVDCDSFDGILPLVVAAAMRGQVILSYQMPLQGVYRSVANLLHVNLSTEKNDN